MRQYVEFSVAAWIAVISVVSFEVIIAIIFVGVFAVIADAIFKIYDAIYCRLLFEGVLND